MCHRDFPTPPCSKGIYHIDAGFSRLTFVRRVLVLGRRALVALCKTIHLPLLARSVVITYQIPFHDPFHGNWESVSGSQWDFPTYRLHTKGTLGSALLSMLSFSVHRRARPVQSRRA